MACARVHLGNGVIAVVCGLPKRKHCRFCGRLATALCDWPKTRVVNVQFADLKIGQDVYPFQASRQVHRLVYLDAKPNLGLVYFATEWNGHVLQREEHQPWRGMWVPQAGTCDAPCCDRCRRHVGPDRDYCRRHWNAWQQVV